MTDVNDSVILSNNYSIYPTMKVQIIIAITIYLTYTECFSNDRIKYHRVANYKDISKTLNKSKRPLTMEQKDTNSESIQPLKSFIAVYEGAVAKMQCDCSSKRESIVWMYAKSSQAPKYVPVVQRDRIVVQNSNISIYRSTSDDGGVYKCVINEETCNVFILEVFNDDLYTVVKHMQPMFNSTQIIGQELIVLNTWSEWSQCSVCGKAGRRRRFGMCYVKLYNNRQNTEYHHNVSSRRSTLLQDFPAGVPCRSQHLPDDIRNLPTVRNKYNVIMLTTCKVQCKDEIFELRSPNGDIIETANNSAGIYSLFQTLPPQPPAPVRNIMFVERGHPVLVVCPGTTLRDIPVTWQVGTKTVEPRVLYRSSGGRAQVNPRDHIVISHVLNEDGNLYSCWEGENLAGTVKLVVWAGGQARWNHHSVLAIMAVIGVVLLHISVRLL